MGPTRRALIIAVTAIVLYYALYYTATYAYCQYKHKDYQSFTFKGDIITYRAAAVKQLETGNFFNYGVGFMSILVFYPHHFFPESLHIYIYMFTKIIFAALTVLLMYLIAWQLKLNSRRFLLGVFLLIANIPFLHWSGQSVPDFFMMPFVAALTLEIILALANRKWYHYLAILVITVITCNFKPILVLMPLPFALYGLWKRNLSVLILTLVLIFSSAVGYVSFTKLNSNPEHNHSRFSRMFIIDGYMIKMIVEHFEFSKGSRASVDSLPYDQPGELISAQYRAYDFYESYWMPNHEADHPSNMVSIMRFFKEYPEVIFYKVFFGMIFFFTLSSIQAEFYISLIQFILLWFILLKGRRSWNPIHYSILAVVLAVWIFYGLLHAYMRYCLPILPIFTLLAAYGMQSKFLGDQA